MTRRRTWAAAALLTGAALVAGAPAEAASTVKVALKADIRSINPGVNRDDNTDAVMLHVVEGLVAYGEDALVKPLLAGSVDVSADGLTYTFKLRKGVRFHNGAELTAADVLWNWQRYTDPRTDWRCLPEVDGRNGLKVLSVTAPDEHTVVMTINKPSALFLDTLARTDCAMTGILHRDSLNADGSFKEPIGTGPYRFAEWRRGEYVRVTRFDAYANRGGPRDGYTGGKAPLVEEVRFVVIPDSSTAKAALLRGDIDLIPDLGNSDVAEVKASPKVNVDVSITTGLVTLLMQTRDPLLSNVKLRQAIAAAIDTPQIVAAVTDGLGKPNNSVVPTPSAYYTPVQAKGYSFDPARAKKLVAEAGYKGEPIVMLANKRYPSSFDSAVVAQAMLQAVGLNVTIEVLEWATQLDRYQKGNYQMMAFPYSGRLDPALSFESVSGPKDKQPRKVWDNTYAQALIEKAMVISDRAERQKIFDELHRHFIADAPMIMLYNTVTAAAFSRRLEGYVSGIAAKPRLWEVRLAD
ncbi:ABC transporter substrate-binding protein [Chelatococcus sp. SYSU_G07232]|uniref:ABC transporter substrate-binding protein n=1 Tax=Chelatococcus albus TaxID=3047466 RepID=A0ABT7AIC3_9HYPH|nr:ABC transporter substrate-binding protein [Chelatococcus sp. SYSU_G07232]MDJ1159132.1 ABC transporter substrate-binding protein [Chelatococcus sp. SYSU_G07232]